MEEKKVAKVEIPLLKRPFEFGELAKIARIAKISRGYICNIVNGSRPCSGKMAQRLVEAAQILGHDTCVFDWTFPKETKHPAFKARRK